MSAAASGRSSLSSIVTTAKRLLVVGLVLGGFACLIAYNLFVDPWVAWWGESDTVTGVVATQQGGEVYLTVSGHSERTYRRDSKTTSVSTNRFPRLTTWRASDGERVAVRQYSPVLMRFSYVEHSIWALSAAEDQVWVMSGQEEVSLHRVDPVTLEDRLDWAGLVGRAPLLEPGVYIERAASRSPVVLARQKLRTRLLSGAYVALDPASLVVEKLTGDEFSLSDELEPDRPYDDPVYKVLGSIKKDLLEPRVALAYDLQGRPDPAVGYLISQTSLDRDKSAVRITRWDTSTTPPTQGWTATLKDVHPECCEAKAWRVGGTTLLWYEHWLVALDDATGVTRWHHRI